MTSEFAIIGGAEIAYKAFFHSWPAKKSNVTLSGKVLIFKKLKKVSTNSDYSRLTILSKTIILDLRNGLGLRRITEIPLQHYGFQQRRFRKRFQLQ